jgi:3-keto-disaccharide hydrolase
MLIISLFLFHFNNIIMKKLPIFFICIMYLTTSFSQREPEATEVWEPEPRVVKTNKPVTTTAPSDAIILFDGSNLDQWVSVNDGDEAKWKLEGDHMTVVAGTGMIATKEKFGDIQLHLEFRTPAEVKGDGQGRGNSGVFLQGRYEVQVLDNYENRTYSNGQCAAIYKQTIPLVNACKKPGEWQSYDIIYNAPHFNADGIKIKSGYVTVIHNGVLVQNHTEIKGTSEYIGQPKNIAHGDAALSLQDHGNPMSFRNIWVRKL